MTMKRRTLFLLALAMLLCLAGWADMRCMSGACSMTEDLIDSDFSLKPTQFNGIVSIQTKYRSSEDSTP